MTLLSPLGLLAGLLAIPVIAMYILRPHRDPKAVSSTYLWRSLPEPVAAAQPWQRLRWTLPLLLQLLMVALLALALARPALATTATLADHTVFIVDASASMSATDERPDRLAMAKDRVRALRKDLPSGAAMSLVVADATPSIVVAETTDGDRFERELDRIGPTVGVAAFGDAFTLAESLVSSSRSTGWVLVSDGGLTIDEQRLAPPGTRYEPVGRSDVNRAITALSVAGVDGVLTAVVTVDNTGGPASTQPLRVDVDGRTVDTRELELPADATLEVAVPIPTGSRVEAFLDGADLLPTDNTRAALAPLAQEVRVGLVSDQTRGSFFVRQALEAMGATVVEATSVEPGAGLDDGVDLVVYDGVDAPTADESVADDTPFITIASPRPPVGLTLVGSIERPVPTFLADDPLLDGVDITRTAIAAAQSLVVDDGVVLIGSAEGEPLVIAGRTGRQRWYHLAFRLEESNLPVSVAYPIMFTRMVAGLTLSDDVPASIEAGGRPPSQATDSTVTSPRGVAYDVRAGARMPIVDHTGFWTVQSDDGAVVPIAAVFPAGESAIAVPAELTAMPAAPPTSPDSGRQHALDSLLPWVIAAALLLLGVELAAGWRSMGVGPVQLGAGLVVRGLIVLALVGALLDVGISRNSDDVRAVLVVDVSDSLDASARADVEAFVAGVRADAAPGALAVVEVGRTAQVASPFGRPDDITLDPPPGDGTDLVRGLRLAESMLDGTTKQRIILLSDGRDTAGGLVDEAQRLAELGVSVDVHTVERSDGNDVAVASIASPATVGEQERFELIVEIFSQQPGPATVDLRRGDELVESREVDLHAGMNEVSFQTTSGSAGLERFTASIRGSADSIPENDVAFAAVGVEGSPRVLIVDDGGDGDAIADALAARAVIVERRDVGGFPDANELSTFSAVVLVDVAADRLGPEHVAALDAFVRDQGNGLVVVGGGDSFALGEYAESELETLLPVESRAEDPSRKASIAEVLLIDASESMGACHCAPVGDGEDPFAGEVTEGGVSKTDISRAAAARAATALSDQDEIGVLAFNATGDWIVPLESVASLGDIGEQLARLQPAGETRIAPALEQAAEALRASDRELKHIVLFSDGFTPELVDADMGFEGMPESQFGGSVVDAATRLHEEEGITISVVATGEGAAPLLEEVALAGGGRFYPGRDLEEVPEIFVEEVRLASRSFINEGQFLPAVTSTAAPVRTLAEAPPVAGYVATTAKDTADVMLQVGEFADPLLASWRIGLGRVTAWTSDGGERWSADWAGWEGWADFWSNVVRDTFPLEGASGHELRTRMSGDSITMELVSEDPWPAGTDPVAHVSTPDGGAIDVELRRVDDRRFEGAVPGWASGSYSIGVTASTSAVEATTRVAAAVVNRSYPLEYRPDDGSSPDLVGLSESTGGRGEITSEQVFDDHDLEAGRSTWRPRHLLLLLAALAWPLDIALRRVQFSVLFAELRLRRATPRPT